MLNNMKTVDIGILITQLSIILAHINLGNKDQKRKAKREYRKLEPYIKEMVTDEAFNKAIQYLGLTEKELNFLERTTV